MDIIFYSNLEKRGAKENLSKNMLKDLFRGGTEGLLIEGMKKNLSDILLTKVKSVYRWT